MSIKLNADQINYINIGLMVLSAGLAFAYPFELFLIVYAVLGPMHYLTEISWLHNKNYYTKGRYDYLFLGMASLGMTFLYLGLDHYLPKGTSEFITYLAFVGALLLLLLNSIFVRLLFFLLAIVAGIGLVKFSFFSVFLACFCQL